MTNEEREEIVFEFMSDYFGNDINENFCDDDIIDAVCTLNELCSAVNAYFEISESIQAIPDFSSAQIGHRYNTALKDKEDWPPRPITDYVAALRKWKTSKDGKIPTHLQKIKTR